MNLSDYLESTLKELNLSRRGFADLLEVSHTTINRILDGSNPEPDILNRIADYLGEPRVKLYRLAGYIPEVSDTTDEDIEQALTIFAKLSPESRKRMLAFLKTQEKLDNAEDSLKVD
jgi:transcriptional regulator with XRE-family HTH domain